jgi:hypothetical protein
MLCIACEKFPRDNNGLCVSCNDDLFAGGYDATYVAEKLLKHINSLAGDITTYERILTEYDTTLVAQHDRITALEAQLAATIATIEASACEMIAIDESTPFTEDQYDLLAAYQISENQRLDAIPEATGADYAEGCKP